MLKCFAGLTVLLVAAGCSGGGTLSSASATPSTSNPSTSPSSPTATPAGIAKTISLAQNGSAPTQGIPGTFTFTAAEYDTNGKLIAGTYPQPIAITTNDTNDLILSALPSSGTSGGSVTILNSQTVVLVTYDGQAIPTGSQLTASANGLASVSASFTPFKQPGGSLAAISTIAIAQTGASPNIGSPGQFALVISAYDSKGTPISGTYATPIIVETNDATDLLLTTTLNSVGTASVTVPNAQTIVFVSYDGKVVPNGTVFSAFANGISAKIPFIPTNPLAPPPIISKIGMTRNGAVPILGDPGVFPIFVTAYDQNAAPITGTWPNAINVTINETCDLSLSLGGSILVQQCPQPPLGSGINVGAVIINSADQVVFLNYDGYAQLPTGTAISATTLANVCTDISFPGNQLLTPCPPPVLAPSLRKRNSFH